MDAGSGRVLDDARWCGEPGLFCPYALSGQIAPLSLFPSFVQIAADILPFRWMLGFPVELLLGRLTPAETLTGLAAQAAWAVVSVFLLRFVWRAGVRSYSAVGA